MPQTSRFGVEQMLRDRMRRGTCAPKSDLSAKLCQATDQRSTSEGATLSIIPSIRFIATSDRTALIQSVARCRNSLESTRGKHFGQRFRIDLC